MIPRAAERTGARLLEKQQQQTHRFQTEHHTSSSLFRLCATWCRCVDLLVAGRQRRTAHDHVLCILHWEHRKTTRVSVVANTRAGHSVTAPPTVSPSTTAAVQFYRECRWFAALTAALRWISSELERCSSGSPSPAPTGRTAGPRSAWPALNTDKQTDRETDRQADRQTERQIGRQTDRQRDEQMFQFFRVWNSERISSNRFPDFICLSHRLNGCWQRFTLVTHV